MTGGEVVAGEVTIEGDDGIGLDLDTPWDVIQAIGATERDARHRGCGEVLDHGGSAAIQGAKASPAKTHGACAVGAGGARGAIACSAGSAAIDACFRAILYAVGAGWRGADHGCAHAAHTVGSRIAHFTVRTIHGTCSTAIDIRLRAVLDHIGARGHGARHHAVAIRAHAIAIDHAVLPVHAIGARGSATIDIGFHPIFRHVHARRGGAHHQGIAIAAHAVAVRQAAIPVHAIGHAGTAAIGVRLVAILEPVHACRRGTHIGHGIAETAHAIVVSDAHLPIGAIVWTRPTAIDVRLHAVFRHIHTCRDRTEHARTDLAEAVRSHHAHLAIGAPATHSATIDVRFRAVFCHVATLCGLTNVGLTNVRHAIGRAVAFDTRAHSVANFTATFHAWKSSRFRRIREHAIGTLISRARLVVGHRIHIVVVRSDCAVSITNGHLAIARRLSHHRWGIHGDVRLDALAHDAIASDTFIGGWRTIRGHGANRPTATHAAHSAAAHSAAAHSGDAARAGHSAMTHSAMTHAAHSSHSGHSAAPSHSTAARR